MIGLRNGTIRLDDHRKEWEEEAQKTISLLKSILGPIIKDIQHVGSTSIYSIKAKPIIDIAIAVDSFEDVLKHEPELLSHGFYNRTNQNLNDQILFACGSYYNPNDSGNLQTHYIHIFLTNSDGFRNLVNFRDYLNKNLPEAKKYEKLKMELAAASEGSTTREAYIRGKHDYITSIYRKAFISSFLGKKVDITIDRKMWSLHPKHSDITYPLNYGFVPNTVGGDGEPVDVYLMGVDKPVDRFRATVIAVVYRRDDVEDKLVAAPEGMMFSKSEIEKAVRFQEKFFDSVVEVLGEQGS